MANPSDDIPKLLRCLMSCVILILQDMSVRRMVRALKKDLLQVETFASLILSHKGWTRNEFMSTQTILEN